MSENVMLQEAIEAIRHGQRRRARDLLTRLLRADQDDPQYWMWMSSVVDTLKEQVYCLQGVLRLDPENQAARQGLVLLGALPPDSNLSPAPLVRRKWEVPLSDIPKPHGLKAILSNPVLRAGAFAVLAVVVLGLILGGVFGLGFGKKLATAFRPTRTPGPPPTFTATPTFIPSTSIASPTPSPTLAGPVPLWMLLEATYTPTPLYVATPHAVSEAFRAGQRAYARGDLAAALDYMQQASQVDPDAADIPYLVGEIYRFLGQPEQALEAFESAIEIEPNFGPAYLGRARARLALKPHADVSDDLQLAIDYDPNYVESFLERAAFRLGQGEVEAVLEDLEAAESLQPDAPLLSLYHAQVALIQGDPTAALEHARRAYDLDRTLLLAYRVLGQAALLNGEDKLAIQSLQTYLTYQPEDATAWADLGQGLYRTGEMYADALAALERALELENELPEALLYRGLTNLELDYGQPAVNDLVAARRFDTRSFPVNLALGRALVTTGRLNEARGQLNNALNLATKDEELAAVYFWRAQLLETLGNPPAATLDWQALLELPEEAVHSDWIALAEQHLSSLITTTPGPTTGTPGARTPGATTAGTKLPLTRTPGNPTPTGSR